MFNLTGDFKDRGLPLSVLPGELSFLIDFSTFYKQVLKSALQYFLQKRTEISS